MLNWVKSLTYIVFLSLIVGTAQANLITNGDFESSDVRENTWRWFPSHQVDGWQGSNIEVWDTFLGVDAHTGVQFAELNAHGGAGGPAYSIFQDVSTQVGGLYDFSFAYRARRSNNEAFSLSIESAGQFIFEQVMNDHTTSEWSWFHTQFEAIDVSTTFTFTAITPTTGTVGNFLDSVSLVQLAAPIQRTPSTPVPEPATILLIVLCGLLIFRLRHN